MINNKKLIIYTDGGARNNPGPAGIGVVIYDEKKEVIKTYREYIGKATNNEAEYRAVAAALELATKYTKDNLDLFLDSEFVVKQLNKEFRVKEPRMKVLFDRVKKLENRFKKVTYNHIPREKNRLADKLVNEAIEMAIG